MIDPIPRTKAGIIILAFQINLSTYAMTRSYIYRRRQRRRQRGRTTTTPAATTTTTSETSSSSSREAACPWIDRAPACDTLTPPAQQ